MRPRRDFARATPVARKLETLDGGLLPGGFSPVVLGFQFFAHQYRRPIPAGFFLSRCSGRLSPDQILTILNTGLFVRLDADR